MRARRGRHLGGDRKAVGAPAVARGERARDARADRIVQLLPASGPGFLDDALRWTMSDRADFWASGSTG